MNERPPLWLILSTAGLALTILVLAVVETDLKAQYLIDQGEYISIVGLAFILAAGVFLYARRRLAGSLPLVFPWLLYPIITQGDQIIDHLSITPMRIIVHLLLAAIFATPVAVVVLGARALVAHGGRVLSRRHAAWLAAALMTAEIVLAYLYLGLLMIATLIIMIAGTLLYGCVGRVFLDPPGAGSERTRPTERFALGVLLVGFAVSLGAYVGYKNQPGAYQGSPSFFMDPNQKDAAYPLDRVAVPAARPVAPASADLVRDALTAYGRTLERLLAGYHLLDRNYTYDFHNTLFVRRRPLVPAYRAAGLRIVDEARRRRLDADRRAAAVRATLGDGDPLSALLEDVRGYAAFNFDRASVLEKMSEGFERTQAGLQHAAHLYEGEGKYLGSGLADLLAKHRAVFEAAAAQPVTAEFAAIARTIHDAYADHIVGF